MTTQTETLKLAFEKMTGVPDAWINPSLRHHRQGFIGGWEAALEYASFMKDLDEALSSPNGETRTEQESDDGYCKVCDEWKCTSKAGCAALDNPTRHI